MPAHVSQIGIRENLPFASPCVGPGSPATTNYLHIGTFGPVVTFTGVVSVVAGTIPPGMAPWVCMAASALYVRGIPLGLGHYTYTLRAGLSNGSTVDYTVTDHEVDPAPYTITRISPTHGSWEGGTTVHIYGTGLGAVDTIQFGLQEGTNIVHVSSTEITAVTPKSGTGRAIARVGANTVPTLLDYTYVVGISLDFDIRRDPDITIEAQRNDAPSTAQFRVQTEEPLIGSHTTITDPATRSALHKGTIVRTQQVYQEGDLTWMATTKDDSWLLDRRRPFGSWGKDLTHPDGWPADEIAEFIRANYTDGFTGTRIQAGLPPITISFDGTQPFSACMTAICQAAGGLIWDATGRDILLGYDTGTVEVTDTFAGDGTLLQTDLFPGDGSTVAWTLTKPLVQAYSWANAWITLYGSAELLDPSVPYNQTGVAHVGTLTGRVARPSPAQTPPAPSIAVGAMASGLTHQPMYDVFLRVAYLFDDGTESFVSPMSNQLGVPRWIGNVRQPPGLSETQGWVGTIPLGGAGVVGRRVYLAWGNSDNAAAPQWVLDVHDNTTTTITANRVFAPSPTDYANLSVHLWNSNPVGDLPFGSPIPPTMAPTEFEQVPPVIWQYNAATNVLVKGAGLQYYDNDLQGTALKPIAPVAGTTVSVRYLYANPSGTSTFHLRSELVLSPVTGLIGLGYVSYNSGAGSLDEPITAPGGGGIWTYDSITNSITRTTGPPATPTPVWGFSGTTSPKNISFTYFTGNGLATTDINNDLLLADPPPTKTVEGTQIRNRVLVLGVGASTRFYAAIGDGGFRVNDATMFKVGSLVRTGADIYTVLSVSYDPVAGPSIGTTTTLVRSYEAGTQVRLYAVFNDLDAQADLATREDGDGVHETTLSFTSWLIPDTVLDTPAGTRATAEAAALAARGMAELGTWAWPVESITYATRDPNTKSGALVIWNMTNPPIVGTYKIQTVRIDQIDVGYAGATVLAPRYTVTASAVRFEFSDLLRKVMLFDATGGGGGASSSFSGGGSGGGGGTGGGAHLIPEYWGETPTGAINGANAVYALSHAYRPGSIAVYLNGVRQLAPDDYTETTDTTFTFVGPPVAGDRIVVDSRGY